MTNLVIAFTFLTGFLAIMLSYVVKPSHSEYLAVNAAKWLRKLASKCDSLAEAAKTYRRHQEQMKN